MVTREVLHKWRHTARGITDEELKALLKYFRGLKCALGPIVPPEYKLVADDVDRQLARLNDINLARKEKW